MRINWIEWVVLRDARGLALTAAIELNRRAARRALVTTVGVGQGVWALPEEA